MDRGAWQATVHGAAKSWTQLGDSHTHTHPHTHTQKKKYIKFLIPGAGIYSVTLYKIFFFLVHYLYMVNLKKCKIYHGNNFEVYSSVVLSPFI